ncbi:MAG TPA: hypothetical protein VGJ21_20245 [Terracidiphilus sp.]|jgi:hypothetical protein
MSLLTLMPLRRSLLLLLCLLVPVLASAQGSGSDTVGPLPAPSVKPAKMTNDSVTKLAKAGLSDDLIVETVNTQPGEFTTDADSLLALKTAGVSDRVIQSMINKGRIRLTGSDPAPAAITLSDVNEIGVYYKDKQGKWQMIDPEIVHLKSGGFLKSTATHGIVKEDENGHLNGRESKLLLPRPIEFLVYAPDGVDIAEYELLRFRLNSNSREFRVRTGGIIHSTGGADRDEVEFKPKKIAPRTWEFTIGPETPGAEYGILPPGTGNVTNGGKIYTFAISE